MHRTDQKWSLIALLVWLLIAATPCHSDEPVKVAAIFSLSGIAAEHNAPLITMLGLAAEEINNSGGLLGRPVSLIVLDNHSTPIGSRRAAEQAVQLNVAAVIGAQWSSHSLAMAPVLQKAGIPMISPGSTNPEVTRVGDCIFRICFLDSFQGAAMARYARETLHARTAVVIKNVDETYCMLLGSVFAQKFRETGGSILWEGDYRGKAVDFSDILTRVKQLKPDVLYLPGYTRDSGLIIRQAGRLDVRTIFLGGDGWDEIRSVAGDVVDGSYQTQHWHPDVPYKTSRHLRDSYRRKFGTDITNFSSPLAYDALMLLRDAARRAGSLEHAKLRTALAQTKAFKGATGILTFDKNGDPIDKAIIILQFQSGKTHFIKLVKP